MPNVDPTYDQYTEIHLKHVRFTLCSVAVVFVHLGHQ